MTKLDFGELSILEELGNRLGLSPDEIRKSIKEPPREDLGDIALASFILAKKVGKDPKDVSEQIKNKIGDLWFLKKTEAYGPYVNLFYDHRKVAESVLNAVNETYGKMNLGNGERVFLEHTSVNPNKALHIGHAKNACIGDSLGRLLRFVNYKTVIANYIDDTGAQVADDIVGIKFLGMPERKDGVKLDIYLGNEVYVATTKAYKTDPSLIERRKQVLKSIEEGKDDIAAFAKKLVSAVVSAQLETLDRLGIYYNLINHEVHILSYKFWETAFEQLKKMGLAVYRDSGDKEGCWVFSARNDDSSDKILVRSDGTVVYVGKDIAYAMWKHGLLDADFRYKKLLTQKNGELLWETTDDTTDTVHPRFNGVKTSITLVDVRQSYEQDVVKDAIRRIAGDRAADYVHYAYEVVALSANTARRFGIEPEEGEKTFSMSGRNGVFINTDDFLNQLYEKVYAETKNRNPNVQGAEQAKIAESITVSTFRYELVKSDPKRMTVFDIDEALKLQEKNAVYLLYTYARASSILNKAGAGWTWSGGVPRELEGKEKKLINLLTKFPTAIFDSTKNLDLGTLSNYLSSLCFEFNSFYEGVQVINAGEEERSFRLVLVASVRNVLKNGMELLGLVPVERI